ncbi:hypothetical protein ACFL4W_04730 [Planctomycetota bacterium]
MRRLLALSILAAGLMLAVGCTTAAVDRTVFSGASMRTASRNVGVDLAGEIGSGFASGGGAAAACGG